MRVIVPKFRKNLNRYILPNFLYFLIKLFYFTILNPSCYFFIKLSSPKPSFWIDPECIFSQSPEKKKREMRKTFFSFWGSWFQHCHVALLAGWASPHVRVRVLSIQESKPKSAWRVVEGVGFTQLYVLVISMNRSNPSLLCRSWSAIHPSESLLPRNQEQPSRCQQNHFVVFLIGIVIIMLITISSSNFPLAQILSH